MTRRQTRHAGHRLSTDTRLPDLGRGGSNIAEIEAPALTVLAHPDLHRIGEVAALPELFSGEAAKLSRLEPLFAAPGSEVARPLADPHVSRKPLALVPGAGDLEIRIERIPSPTPITLDGEPLDEGRSLGWAALDRGVVLELGPHVALLLGLEPPFAPRVPRFGLVGESGVMVRLRREIEVAARLETSVLLRGASGTGKELVARALHDAGVRRDKPWVTVNMAAVPPSLAAAELFGAKKGAFTGADRQKQGFFAAADGGTLFLDEIGDTPPDVQPLLLRCLESGEIQPVGSAETRRVDVRVIAATDADLDRAIADGRFREPLLHRLAGWEIHLPPLAERRSDIGRLLVHFASRELGRDLSQLTESDGPRPWASASLMARLARYDWPGNVRQLANVARRLAILCRADPAADVESFVLSLLADAPPRKDETPEPAAPPPSTASHPAAGASPTGRWRPVYRKAEDVDDEELITTLRAQKWDLKPTAEALGISRSVLYRLIDACPGVRTAADLDTVEIEEALARENGDLNAAAAALEVSAQGLKMRMKALGLR